MKKAFKNLLSRPALSFFLAASIWVVGMFFINNRLKIQWKEIFVEANGMVFDLIVFGVLLSLYDSKRQKNERIEQDKRLIDDFRSWDEPEAMYRILGAIKRLKKEKAEEIDLNSCFLVKADLSNSNLEKVDFTRANLSEANLIRANLANANLANANLRGSKISFANLMNADLSGAILEESNLNKAQLIKTNLFGAYLSRADLTEAKLNGANISEANLSGATLLCVNFLNANLSEADLTDTDLHGALVGENWMEKLERWKVKGRKQIKEKYLIDESGTLQLK